MPSLDNLNLPSPEKAKTMLKEGVANGKELSPGQKRLFGLIAAGKMPSMMKMLKKAKKK